VEESTPFLKDIILWAVVVLIWKSVHEIHKKSRTAEERPSWFTPALDGAIEIALFDVLFAGFGHPRSGWSDPQRPD
jgi:hypothetical protein